MLNGLYVNQNSGLTAHIVMSIYFPFALDVHLVISFSLPVVRRPEGVFWVDVMLRDIAAGLRTTSIVMKLRAALRGGAIRSINCPNRST